MTNIVVSIFLISTFWSYDAFNFMQDMTSVTTLLPYLLVAAYAFLIARSGEGYETVPGERKRDQTIVVAFFPLFFLGAIFGKLMDYSAAARSIANWVIDKLGAEKAILAVVLCCAVLTYSGASLFVVALAIFPIAAALFRDANIPKRLIPGTLALGAFSFTMTALPGTSTNQNAIPMPFFEMTVFAAPGLGLIASFITVEPGLAKTIGRAQAILFRMLWIGRASLPYA